jgi:pimeloyl-ACP methyl ester carboxylesterase
MPVLANIYYTHHRGGITSRLPVILIHGAGSNYLCWPAEIRRLRNVSVYAIDLPGHGKSTGTAHHRVTSYQSAIIDFISQLGINRAVLVGHSLGAAIGLQLALDHPELVSGLICIAGAASFQIDPVFINLFRLTQTQKTALELMKTYFAPHCGNQLWFPHLLKSLEKVRNSLWYADLRASEQFDLRSQLSQIYTPTLVLSGTHDPMVSSSSASYLAHQLPNAELIRFYQHGHMLMLEDPKSVANHIRDFYWNLSV